MYQRVNKGVLVVPLMLSLDEATVDGNGRKSLIPVFISFLCLRAKTRNKEWARQLLAYVPKFNKAKWPHDMGKDRRQALKRETRARAIVKILAELNHFGRTGVRIELPGRDGQWHTVAAVFMVFFIGADHKAIKEITHTKDAYRCMPAFCAQCANHALHVGHKAGSGGIQQL